MVMKSPNEYMKGKTIVYLVRHGDRIFLPEQENAGLDTSGPGLSKLGLKQAKEVAKKFSKIKGEIDVIYSSSMTRALETAKEISHRINKKPKVFDELSEFNKVIWARKYHTLSFWKHWRKHRLSLKVFNKILKENEGKVIVIVAHGNVIKGLIGNKLGVSLRKMSYFDYHNCHITLARFKGKKLDYIHYFNSKELV